MTQFCVENLHTKLTNLELKVLDAHVWIDLVLGADGSYSKTTELLVVQIQENLSQAL